MTPFQGLIKVGRGAAEEILVKDEALDLLSNEYFDG